MAGRGENTRVDGQSKRYTSLLKSGCLVEDLRLEDWDALEKAVTIEAAVATRIVSLRDLARETPRRRLWRS